jgi:hypothetical protein
MFDEIDPERDIFYIEVYEFGPEFRGQAIIDPPRVIGRIVTPVTEKHTAHSEFLEAMRPLSFLHVADNTRSPKDVFAAYYKTDPRCLTTVSPNWERIRFGCRNAKDQDFGEF